jgi:hypothetical protein
MYMMSEHGGEGTEGTEQPQNRRTGEREKGRNADTFSKKRKTNLCFSLSPVLRSLSPV